MSLKDLLDKYEKGKLPMDGWFVIKDDPTLDDAKRIAEKGRLEDKGFRIPLELRQYLDISSEGKLIEKQEIPEELQGLAEEIREAFRRVADD